MHSQFRLQLHNRQVTGPILSSFEKKPIPISGDVSDTSMVSCIMPTVNRSKYIERSIKYFESQDYPYKELIIIYEKESDLPSIKFPKNVRLKKTLPGTSIGEKRNQAFRMAKGMYIAQWDDDDIYSPKRLSVQLQPIIEGQAEITSLNDLTFFDYETWRFWKCSERLMDRMFVHAVAGGALVYHRRCFHNCSYPNTSLREDADFLCRAMMYGNRLKKLSAEGIFIYLRHSMNTWRFQTGQFISDIDWIEVEQPQFFKKHVKWYQKVKSAKPKPNKGVGQPMVSCIMPTYNRRPYIEDSIQNFLQQDYANKELIIVDDGTDSIEDIVPKSKLIQYHRLPTKHTIGEKRNMANEKAKGEIIMHFDDDDWYHSNWITQVVQKLMNNVDVTGLSTLYFKSDNLKQAWQYHYPDHDRPWVHGATFGYWKRVWENSPFSMINIGEDNQFLWDKQGLNISAVDFIDGYIGNVHQYNTSPKYTAGERWKDVNYMNISNLRFA